MLLTGSSMVMPFSTTALDRFMPVTMPVRSPSRTSSALQSMSRMMRPAEAIGWTDIDDRRRASGTGRSPAPASCEPIWVDSSFCASASSLREMSL